MRMIIALVLSLQATSSWSQNAENGEEIFKYFCASCHGQDASGNGPISPVLLVQPADLTALSSGNDGQFPIERVASRIDGRDPIVSHGSDMPVFGWLFEGQPVALKLATGQPILIDRPVADLLTWLQTIQD